MSKAIDQQKLDEFMDQVKKVEKGHKLDLSSDEDLSIAVMNLISMEEHFFFTAKKTGNDAYFELLSEIREMRKGLLKKLIKEYDGEVWCISKHLLAASMRLMEVGTKAMATRPAEAREFFEQSYRLYNLFWALNLKMVDTKTTKELSASQKKILAQIEKEDTWSATDEKTEVQEVEIGKTVAVGAAASQEKTESMSKTAGMWQKLGQALNKALDCCRE